MFRALIGISCLVLTGAPAAAIVGGAQPAEQALTRHVVVISGATGLCSGVAIGPDLVLTAAHCVAKTGMQRVATFDGRRMSVKTVEAVAGHPQYAPREDAPDVALIKLAAKPAPNLAPLPFSDRRAPIGVGDRFIVAGFGLANQKDRNSAGKLRTATLVATGRPNTQVINLVDPNTLGEKPGLGVCNGDSGGPAFELRDGKLALIGIISWTAGPDIEPQCGFVSGIIPLPRYRYWIVEQAAKLGSPIEP
jgi:secreted trypsin-like serine protease